MWSCTQCSAGVIAIWHCGTIPLLPELYCRMAQFHNLAFIIRLLEVSFSTTRTSFGSCVQRLLRPTVRAVVQS